MVRIATTRQGLKWAAVAVLAVANTLLFISLSVVLIAGR